MGSRVKLVPVDLRDRLSALGIRVADEQDADAVFALYNAPGAVLYLVSEAGLVGTIKGARLGQSGYFGGGELVFPDQFQYELERLRGGDKIVGQLRAGTLADVVAALEFLADEVVRRGGSRTDTGLAWSLYCMLMVAPFRRMRKFWDVVAVVRHLTTVRAEPRVLYEALMRLPRGEQWLERATAAAVFNAQHPGLHPQLVTDLFS